MIQICQKYRVLVLLFAATLASAKEEVENPESFLPPDIPLTIPHITDPVCHSYLRFLQSHMRDHDRYKGGPFLYCLEFDITQDGKKDMFTTASFLRNGKAGNIWHLYVREEEDYAFVMDACVFDRRGFRIVSIEESGEPIIVCFRPGGSDTAFLMAIRFCEKESKFEEWALADIDWTEETRDDASILRALLVRNPVEVVATPFSELEKRGCSEEVEAHDKEKRELVGPVPTPQDAAPSARDNAGGNRSAP